MSEWTLAVKAWEKDQCQPNPLVPTLHSLMYHKVQLNLATEDEHCSRQNPASVDSEFSPLHLVMEGLELEEQQQQLKWDTDHIGQHPTSLQQSKIKE
ncbi:hypothetical protein GYMLUDRAFT_248835 [Collybiopsis luxurians FD-317 M1]|uniref:Uncharacterized protein n=1 Tax=Collybiopsis luxurians FD-317 M1 TaxID=944289 RepID=A0A0D0CB05_9AGAR|nr:hypothetical protein GYMLUDRAFT_248835 [Collybiopsis luxurians FD-317 M1]